jgi:DNA-binding MarR family transcriptional regulator
MVDHLASPHLLEVLEGFRRRLGRELSNRALEQAVALRGADGRILDLLGEQGARPTDLAAGAWITKQAITKRIRDLERRGLVDVTPDPADGRAVLVTRTALGDDVWSVAKRAIADIEIDLAAEVGEERYAAFRSVLDELGVHMDDA